MQIVWAAAITLVFVTASGCGDDGDAGGGGDAGAGLDGAPGDATSSADGGDRDGGEITPIDFATFCTEHSRAILGYYRGCYGDRYDPTAPEEVARYAERCLVLEEAVEAGRVGYDGARAAACVAAIAAMDCTAPGPDPEAAGCTTFFEPRFEPGQPCHADAKYPLLGLRSMCVGGYCTLDGCPGRCVAHAAEGAGCGDHPDQCAPDLYCAEGTCEPRLGEGASCAGTECAAGLVCTGDPLACVRPLPYGSACAEDYECESPQCVGGVCQFRVGSGGPCRGKANCPLDERCFLVDGATVGTCGEPVARTGACEGSDVCDDGLYCYDGACDLSPGDGASCAAGGGPECAEGLYCNAGVCQPTLGSGATCDPEAASPDGPCGEGVFCMAVGTCLPPGAEAEPCRSTAFTPTCEAGLLCDPDSETCVTPPGEGEPCRYTLTPACQEGLGCACGSGAADCDGLVPARGDTCQPLAGYGDACTRPEECASGACGDGVCTPGGGNPYCTG